MYRVTIDTDACDGIFACMMRDDRIVERGDGVATYEGATEEDGRIVAEFDDDRIEQARQAAAACPPSAIEVEKL